MTTEHKPLPYAVWDRNKHRHQNGGLVYFDDGYDSRQWCLWAFSDNAIPDDETLAFIVLACNSHDDLVAACEAGGRYCNALKKHQDAGRVGDMDATDELECLFADWHDKTHDAIARPKDAP